MQDDVVNQLQATCLFKQQQANRLFLLQADRMLTQQGIVCLLSFS